MADKIYIIDSVRYDYPSLYFRTREDAEKYACYHNGGEYGNYINEYTIIPYDEWKQIRH